MYHIVAIDDELKAINRFQRLVQKEPRIITSAVFTNTNEALEYCRLNKVDIAFLDIDMPKISGLELAELIQKDNPRVDIVFITAYDQYALDAFRVHAFDYLLKPIGSEDLQRLIDSLDLKKNHVPDPSPVRKLRIQCFGAFNCYVNCNSSEYIRWRTSKTEELFALLLHYNGIAISKELIIDKLWPDTTLDKASNYFRVTCTYLRKNLEDNGFPDMLKRDRDNYSLKTERIDCDIHKFQLKIKPGIDLLSYEELEETALLYSAPCFVDKAYEWSAKFNQWLENEYIRILYKLADEDERQCNYEKVCERMKLVSLHDAFDDEAMIRFIASKLKLGDSASATIAYQRYKDYIWKELGINPSEKLQILMKLINNK